jgi:hypothetical protein
MTFARDLASFADSATQNLSFRNLIINGDMSVDQRNNGAAVTGQTTNFFVVDRFVCTPNASGIFTGQRVTTAPTGFNYSLKLTVTTARASIASTDVYGIRQRIEGLNSMQLRFGNSDAKTVTLSFWVQSSVTGTYAVTLFNGSYNRSYIATYSISAANTWEKKTITITGDTTGTWAIDNTIGVEVFWDLGSGSNSNGTANAWAAVGAIRTSATTNWISNSGATFLITGVQLEAGPAATPFEFLPITTELQLCQRYFTRLVDPPGIGVGNGSTVNGASRVSFILPVEMRAVPTITSTGTFDFWNGSTVQTSTSFTASFASKTGLEAEWTITGAYTIGHAVKAYTSGSTTKIINASIEL